MENNSEVVYLHLDDIIPNRFQPREVFDEQALKELAVSIKEHGVIQPIIVRQVENKYEIIAGERRYKASTMAGLNKIPAIIKNLDDKESSKVALIENLQRRDLTPIEEARTFQKILDLEEDMTQEQLAATMGKTQSSVSNKLRLLALPDEIQDALLNEKISERHARCLLTVEDANEQVKLLGKIIEEKLTVRELDKIVKEMKEGPSASSSGESKLEGPETAKEENPSPQPKIEITPVIKGFPVAQPTKEEPKQELEKLEDDKIEVQAPVQEAAQPAPVATPEQPAAPEQAAPVAVPAAAPVQETPAPVEQAVAPAPAPAQPAPVPEPVQTPAPEQAEPEETKAPEVTKPVFNFDFSKISNPFLKKSEQPEPTGDTNIPSVMGDNQAVSAPAPTKDFNAVKTDIDSLVTSLKGKGFTCEYKELDGENKIEYTITSEK